MRATVDVATGQADVCVSNLMTDDDVDADYNDFPDTHGEILRFNHGHACSRP